MEEISKAASKKRRKFSWDSLNEMRSFDDVLTPLSWLLFAIASFFCWYVIFSPTWKELALLILIDLLILIPVQVRVVDRHFRPLLFPDSKAYLPKFSLESFRGYSTESQIALLTSLMKFPLRMAKYSWLASFFFKVIPGFLIVVLVWHHECSNSIQFIKLSAVMLVTYTYFFAAVVVENHGLVSKVIGQLHQSYDWKQAFEVFKFPYTRRQFEVQEQVAIVSIFILVLALQATLVPRQISFSLS